MSRSKASRPIVGALVLLLAGGLFMACSGDSELGIIRSFFQASRFDDRATLGNMAMVSFDPVENGIASGISVESVGEEQRRPLRMLELVEKVAQVQAEEEDFTRRKQVYQGENMEAITRVLEAEREREDVARRDEEVQVAWTQWRNETMDQARKISEAQSELSSEGEVAQVSVFDPDNPIDVQEYGGELISKDVVVSARIRKGDMEEERTMTVTLQRVTLGEGEDAIEGRWIITGVD